MIIRSQDNKKLFNLEKIRKIDCETNSVMADDTSVMGKYSTEEKAIKVLDMIQIAYEEANSVCNMSGFVANTVFQMPQDEEV